MNVVKPRLATQAGKKTTQRDAESQLPMPHLVSPSKSILRDYI